MQPLASVAARAVVIDDLDLVRVGLTQALRRAGATRVEEHSSERAVRGVSLDGCDLVLLGPHLVEPASVLASRLKASGHQGAIVHLTTAVDRGEFVELLRCGVDAVAPFASGQAELDDLLRRVAGGERVFDGVALQAVRPALQPADGQRLSPREGQVLGLLATNRTMRGIADEMILSVATVKTHASNLYAKLDVRCRADAVERGFALRVLEGVV